jgi:glycosyltransferase involved in cell wall biosynthesis
MRIQLIVHHELDRNAGAPGATYQLSRQYEELGHEVRIYSYGDLPDSLGPRAKQLLFPAFVALFLARAVRVWRPDVVDASTADTWVWSRLDPARRRVLLATTSHGLEHTAEDARKVSEQDGILELSWKNPLYYGGLHLGEVKASLRRADLCFLLNRVDRDYAVARLGVLPERAHIVPNGISEGHLDLPIDPTPRDASATIRIAQVGSHLVQKGVGYSAAALETILRTYPHTCLSLLGTALPADTVLADFDRSLHNRITVVRRYEYHALPKLLLGQHVIVFPTLSEGFGIALLEAMACGLAPVSTAAAGPSEFVRDGENGLLVPLRDSGALATAIGRLIDDRELLDRLRHAAHQTAQRYSWQAAARLRLSAYESALSAR